MYRLRRDTKKGLASRLVKVKGINSGIEQIMERQNWSQPDIMKNSFLWWCAFCVLCYTCVVSLTQYSEGRR